MSIIIIQKDGDRAAVERHADGPYHLGPRKNIGWTKQLILSPYPPMSKLVGRGRYHEASKEVPDP